MHLFCQRYTKSTVKSVTSRYFCAFERVLILEPPLTYSQTVRIPVKVMRTPRHLAEQTKEALLPDKTEGRAGYQVSERGHSRRGSDRGTGQGDRHCRHYRSGGVKAIQLLLKQFLLSLVVQVFPRQAIGSFGKEQNVFCAVI